MKSKSMLLKVRSYIHDKYQVFFVCVRGELLYSSNVLEFNEVEDVLNQFAGLECFTFSDGQTFCFSDFIKPQVL